LFNAKLNGRKLGFKYSLNNIFSASFGVPVGSPYPALSPGSLAPPRSMFTPYRGNITVVDSEGKELMLVDDKHPFNYFYNLGLEVVELLHLSAMFRTVLSFECHMKAR